MQPDRMGKKYNELGKHLFLWLILAISLFSYCCFFKLVRIGKAD